MQFKITYLWCFDVLMDELQWWFAIFIGYAFCCLFVIKCLLRSNAFVAFFVIIPKGHRGIDPLLPMFGKQGNWSLAVISYVLKYLDQKVAFVVATLWLGGWYQKRCRGIDPVQLCLANEGIDPLPIYPMCLQRVSANDCWLVMQWWQP